MEPSVIEVPNEDVLPEDVLGVPLPDEETTSSKDMALWELVQSAGWFVYPLGAFSVWALYLVFANALILQENRLVPVRLAKKIKDSLLKGNIKEVASLVSHRQDLLSKMVSAGIPNAGRDPHFIETAMEGNISREMVRLHVRIRRLADIGNLAPMLGLLGTVWGMLRVFKGISIDPDTLIANWSSVLSNGVAQAMVTTVMGLVIAIPAFFFYYVFRNKLAKIIGRIESFGTELANLMSRQGHEDHQ